MWDWIVQILFQALELIQRFAGDWGLSIIILVVIIRLLLTPMMLKSIKSTARMQVLQPKLLEIQERYAADPQRQAEELQKFYSENKFNPFGGCLPLLIQMPILVALFNLCATLVIISRMRLRRASPSSTSCRTSSLRLPRPSPTVSAPRCRTSSR